MKTLLHSLGSAHDGEGNDCDPKQHYLLTPKLEIASITNYHTFSECSRDSFEKYITSLNRLNPRFYFLRMTFSKSK